MCVQGLSTSKAADRFP